MRKFRLREIVESTFTGSWGEEPLIEGSSENVRVIRSTELGDRGIVYSTAAVRRIPGGELGSKRLLSGDLIIECSGGGPGRPVGRVAIFNNDPALSFTCSNFLRCIRVADNVAWPGYVNRYLQWVYQKPIIERFQQQTTGIINLNFREYLDQEIELPSLGEQRRIAGILDSADSLIDATAAEIRKLESVRQGLMRQIEARITSDAMSTRSLSELADVRSGLTLGSEPAEGAAVELPYLRVANVQDGFVDTADVKTVRVLAADQARFSLRKGDVLLTEGGDADKLGRGAVWDGRIEPCLHQNHIFRVRCGEDLLPEYLSLYTSSARGKKYFLDAAKQTTNLASINSTQLKAMPVPLLPLEDQRQIVQTLGRASRRIESIQAELSKLQALKEGLAADLLSGRVRVSEVA